MEQIMGHLLAKIGAMQENVVSQHKKIMIEKRAWQKEMKADLEAVEAYPERCRQIQRNEVCSSA
jgi:hypothetical protein